MQRAARSIATAVATRRVGPQATSTVSVARLFSTVSETMRGDAQYILGTFARQPLEMVRGEGVWLWDAHDIKYMGQTQTQQRTEIQPRPDSQACKPAISEMRPLRHSFPTNCRVADVQLTLARMFAGLQIFTLASR